MSLASESVAGDPGFLFSPAARKPFHCASCFGVAFCAQNPCSCSLSSPSIGRLQAASFRACRGDFFQPVLSNSGYPYPDPV